MRIGIDASRVTTTERTGTEGYSYHLIKHLLSIDRQNEYTLYLRCPLPAALSPSLALARLRVMPFPRLWTHLRLSWEMALHPPDVLFVPAHVLPLVHPKRSVVTVHDLGYLYEPQAHRPAERWYLNWSTRYNARAATLVIADSQATKQDLVKAYHIPPEKIRVVYLGVDQDLGPVKNPAEIEGVKVRYGIHGDYFLSVGTLQPRKNLARLIEAFVSLPVKDDVKLVLAGKPGWQSGEIMGKLAELCLLDRVILTGYVPEEHLPALYSGAVALVFPSLYEGFGLPALEAMACGLPVIAAKSSSLPEVVGEAGLLVDPLDVRAWARAMAQVLDDPVLRVALRQKGLRRARMFSWERCAREALEVLEEAGMEP